MYIAEVAPARIRGQLVSINQMTIVIGVLLAQVSNLVIAHLDSSTGSTDPSAREVALTWSGQYGWRWMFGVEAVPALAFLLLMLTVPESPRWLIMRGATARARMILARISRDVSSVATIDQSSDVGGDQRPLRSALPIIGLGIIATISSQWTGVNVIFYYAEEIFAAAGYGVSGVMLNIVITGIALLVGTIIATVTVDKLGRRTLMLAGYAGLALIYGTMGLALSMGRSGAVVVGLCVAAIVLYATTMAPLTWVILSEIFPNRVRGLAMSVSIAALWIGNFALSFTFPFLNQSLRAHGCFWLYSAICMAACIYFARTLPETRGKTLEQIESESKSVALAD